ncbi:MAG TPA: nucleoside recognition domain-containing protein [Chitinispirillaceae bacterium]|nr:nucleoside recognition domain-containing protein [Chitinispirillaceae bacterium]
MMEKKPAAINVIWLFLIMSGILTAAYTNSMDVITKASFDAAKNAVTLAINLIGAMALWLGIMKVAEHAGLMKIIARAIRPVMVWLFPDVPAEHPAMSAMIMNMAANMLGLGNAATPMGIKAMTELEKINPQKGTATNAMCLFLAINTSSVTILPLGVIAVRAAAGATSPSAILVPAILATAISTTVAIVMAKLFASRSLKTENAAVNNIAVETSSIESTTPASTVELVKVSPLSKIVGYSAIAIFLFAIPWKFISHGTMPHFSFDTITRMTDWLIPLIMGGLLLFGYLRGVKVYESVTEGAKEGFDVAVRIIPYMVAIFVAIGIFRESGALTIFTKLTAPLLSLIGMPAEVLPMALLRPLSGTGSFGIMSEIISKGPDGFSAFLASIIQGSTETTFYVIAVYFGAVGIKKTRFAIPAALCADAAGILGSVFLSHIFFK